MWDRGRTVTARTGERSFDELLAGLAGGVLVACALWAGLWVLAALIETLTDGRLPALGWVGAPTRVRPVLLTVVGLLLVGTPAHAASRPDPDPTSPGLPVPARPVAGSAFAPAAPRSDAAARASRPEARPAAVRTTAAGTPVGRTVVVRRGDTLWGLVAEHLPAGAAAGPVADGVRAWHARNRAVIGPDPDLIRPGQRLHPPGSPRRAAAAAPDRPPTDDRFPSHPAEEKP